MSFIGNIAAAQSAKAMGKYNQQLYNQQAQLERQKAEQNFKVYEQIQKPQLIEQQEQAYANFFVGALKSGAEFRGTPSIVGLKNRATQLFDLTMADYNAKTNRTNTINQSILLQAKGAGEAYKGRLEARTQYIKAGASLLTMGVKSYQEGGLVIV